MKFVVDNLNQSEYKVFFEDEETSRNEDEDVLIEGNKYEIFYKGEENYRDEGKDLISDALAELTSFEIKKSYKDKYRTIPCTKLVNATNNRRIYFACPKREDSLTFYINTKRVVLPSFDIDLGYIDVYGNPIMYTVYYTTTGYNSNSVLFEVKKGGMS